MRVKKLKHILWLVPVLLVMSSCDEDMSYKGMHQNYDTDRYKPNYNEEYAPIPAQRTDRYSDEDYGNDIDHIRAHGLSSYIDNAVTPDLPCGYAHIAPGDITEFDETKECIPYNKDQFGANGGTQLAAFIQSESGKGTAAKKAAFYRAFGPLAVKMQDETGYPASALLSQWAEETGWGVSSRLLRRGNGIGGHSCFSRKDSYEYPVFRKPGTKEPGSINVSCTYNRPSNEGHYYLTFETLEDSAYAQVHNLLFNRGTQRNYGGIRAEVHAANIANRKAEPRKVLDGMKGYAAFPPDYSQKLFRRIERDNLKRFDNLTICKTREETSGVDGGKD